MPVLPVSLATPPGISSQPHPEREPFRLVLLTPGVVMGRSVRPGPSIFRIMGRGPARLIVSHGGPRPGPADQIFI